MRGVTYPILVRAGSTEVLVRPRGLCFVRKIVAVELSGPELAWLDGIFVGCDPKNQLTGRVDLWHCSSLFERQQRQEFLERHGLEGKSDSEIDDYLDEHELALPTSLLLDLPMLEPGEPLRLTGEFTVDVALAVHGMEPG